MKRCCTCGKVKPRHAFSNYSDAQDGKQPRCRECFKVMWDDPPDQQCIIGKRAGSRCPIGIRGRVSYCLAHDRMFSFLRIAEITEWHLSGKIWVPPPIKERRDARSGDGHLYVCEWNDLIVFGIAAAPELVESRLREHERFMPGLEELERYSFVGGEAYRQESALKRLLSKHDHFPWLPKGTPKWTEVVSKAVWDADLSPIIKACHAS